MELHTIVSATAPARRRGWRSIHLSIAPKYYKLPAQLEKHTTTSIYQDFTFEFDRKRNRAMVYLERQDGGDGGLAGIVLSRLKLPQLGEVTGEAIQKAERANELLASCNLL